MNTKTEKRVAGQPVGNRTIYVSAQGNDESDGLSEATAIQTIDRLNAMIVSMPLTAGDRILLRKGDTFTGEIRLTDVSGTADAPLYIGSYGTADAAPEIVVPPIDNGVLSADVVALVDQTVAAAGKTISTYTERFTRPADSDIHAAVRAVGCRYITVENIRATADNDGMTYYSNQLNAHGVIDMRKCTHIVLRDLHLQGNVLGHNKTYMADVTDCLYTNPNGTYYPYQGNEYYGVMINGAFDDAAESMDNVIIENVHADGFSAAVNFEGNGFIIRNCKATNCPNWAFILAGIDGQVLDCTSDHTGFGTNSVGNAAFMMIKSKNIVFSGLRIVNACRPSDANWDGAGFDFEGAGNENITLKDSYFEHIDGAAIMLFTNRGDAGFANKNVVVENVFIRDYLLAGAYFGEGAISMDFCGWASMGKEYPSTAVFKNVTVVKSGDNQFYTGYSDPSAPLLESENVKFVDCSFLLTDPA